MTTQAHREHEEPGADSRGPSAEVVGRLFVKIGDSGLPIAASPGNLYVSLRQAEEVAPVLPVSPGEDREPNDQRVDDDAPGIEAA